MFKIEMVMWQLAATKIWAVFHKILIFNKKYLNLFKNHPQKVKMLRLKRQNDDPGHKKNLIIPTISRFLARLDHFLCGFNRSFRRPA
jgi:hypothetical protein